MLLAREGPETSAGPGDPVRTRRAWALRASRDDGQPPSPRQVAVSTEPPGSHWSRRARHPHARVSREACTKPANWTPRGPRGAEGFERQRVSATCRRSRPLSGGRLHAWFREVPAARARPVPPAAVARPSRWPWEDTGGREPGARDLSWAPKPLRQGLGVLPVPCGPRVCGFTGHLAGPTAAPGRPPRGNATGERRLWAARRALPAAPLGAL